MRVDRLKSLREKNKLTHAEFAERLGVGVRQIARYESGENDPTSDVLKRIADVLGVSADYLLGLTDEQKPYIQVSNLSDDEKEAIWFWRNSDKVQAIKVILKDDKLVVV